MEERPRARGERFPLTPTFIPVSQTMLTTHPGAAATTEVPGSDRESPVLFSGGFSSDWREAVSTTNSSDSPPWFCVGFITEEEYLKRPRL